jgi:hypothetical protein
LKTVTVTAAHGGKLIAAEVTPEPTVGTGAC